ncbi:MAG: sugar ABC transporter permease [Clostridia bacterium]|nr:sugar ABC transporter permease [Clostridia bacterium]MBR1685373.1 sugar ABC transporter permease [Clostridia bacterium]
MSFRKKLLLFLSFAGPAMLFFCCVVIIPLIYGIYLTFTDWNGLSDVKTFVGFENYIATFHDTTFWQTLLLTTGFAILSVLFINVIAFLLAYLLTSGVKGQNFFRAGFFTPNLIGGLILGYIWQIFFSRVLTSLYTTFPIALLQKSWLSSPNTAFAALVIVQTWQLSGYMLLIYISGFVGISEDVLEAAKIDGATEQQTTWHIRLPLMVPSFVVCLFLSLTRSFKVYDLNLSLTAGGPYNSTKMTAMHIYTQAFENHRYGVGQAEALIFFIVIAVISLTQTYIGKKREVEA